MRQSRDSLASAKVGSCDRAAETHVIELAADRAKACFNVTQAFAIGQLGKDHRQELIPARKRSQVLIAVITSDTFLKFFVWYVVDELRENGPAKVHSNIVESTEIAFSSKCFYLDFKSFPTTK